MRRFPLFAPSRALKLFGALALIALVGACQQVPPPRIEAKPSQPIPAAPPPPAAPTGPAPGSFEALFPPAATRSGTAAVLVPLTGPQAGLGTALLNAAQLALFELGDDSFTMMAFDTRGTPEGAEQAARQALTRQADIVIGPLLSAEVRAAAQVTRAAHVPMLAFTTDRTAAGDGVYLVSFLPGPQALTVVNHARSLGRSRLAVLAPSNDYGRIMVDFLTANLPDGAAGITSVTYYDPATLDWNAIAGKVMTAKSAQPGDPGFDALLLPDDGDRLRALAAALSFQGLDPARVKILGTMLWQGQRVGTDPALTGAWYAAPPAAAQEDFERRYTRAFGGRAPRLATLGYDAMALAVVLARKNPRDFSTPALTNPTGFLGVDGLFRLQSSGAVERGYAVFETTAGGIDREVDPAPQTFPAAF